MEARLAHIEDTMATKDQLKALGEQMHAGFGYMEKRFAAIDKRFDDVDRRFVAIDKRFDKIEDTLETIIEAVYNKPSRAEVYTYIAILIAGILAAVAAGAMLAG